MASDRMFQVIVLGGIALAGGACGGRVVVDGNSSAGVGGAGGFGGAPFHGTAVGAFVTSTGGFPNEGPATTVGAGGFPNEGPIQDAGVDGFPTEADPPPPFDAGDDSGFPNETAVPPP